MTTTESNTSTTEQNKALVRGFLDELLANGPSAAFDKYCHPERYKQHNPRLVGGKEGFLEFGRNVALCEGFTFEIRKMAAEGDLVWMMSESTGFHWSDEPGPVDPASLRHVWIDIFKIEDGRFVEHWDIYQRIPPYTANGNDMI